MSRGTKSAQTEKLRLGVHEHQRTCGDRYRSAPLQDCTPVKQPESIVKICLGCQHGAFMSHMINLGLSIPRAEMHHRAEIQLLA